MIRASELPIETLSQLGGLAAYAVHLCGGDPRNLLPGRQAKIRKTLCENYGEIIYALPQQAAACFDSAVSDEELLVFLSECKDLLECHYRHRDEVFEETIAFLPPAVGEALQLLAQHDFWPPADASGRLPLDEEPAFRQWLVLEDPQGLPAGDTEWMLEDLALSRHPESGHFRMELRLENPDTGQLCSTCVNFTGAAVEGESQDCTAILGITGNPWNDLCAMASSLCRKARTFPQLCSPEESALLPLCREAAALGLWYGDEVPADFPLLEEMLAPCPPKALQLLRRMKTALGTKKHTNAAMALRQELSRAAYEPLWRDIYERICRSQRPYRRCCAAPPELRAAIDGVLAGNGFTGTYPDYTRTGAIRGPRLAESYDMSYWIWNEKRVLQHIRCAEITDGTGLIGIRFLCGTAALRRGDAPTDLFGCMFNAGGRRFFRTCQADDPLRGAAIAVKKAQLEKLTPEERAACGQPGADWGLFWWFLLLGGGMFGIFMTLGMMLLGAAAALLFGQPEIIGQMMTEIPWGQCLAFCWIAFGGIMGLITVLAKQK